MSADVTPVTWTSEDDQRPRHLVYNQPADLRKSVTGSGIRALSCSVSGPPVSRSGFRRSVQQLGGSSSNFHDPRGNKDFFPNLFQNSGHSSRKG